MSLVNVLDVPRAEVFFNFLLSSKKQRDFTWILELFPSSLVFPPALLVPVLNIDFNRRALPSLCQLPSILEAYDLDQKNADSRDAVPSDIPEPPLPVSP